MMRMCASVQSRWWTGVLTLLRPLPDTGPPAEGWDHHPRPTWDLGEGSRKTHHVSVLDVNIPSMKASGGIHFTGSIAQPPFR